MRGFGLGLGLGFGFGLAPTLTVALALTSDLVSHAPEGEYMGIAPLRILSFDIECAGRPGIFPEVRQPAQLRVRGRVRPLPLHPTPTPTPFQADKDPIIQIANFVTCQGSDRPIVRNVFTLKECAPISGAQVLSWIGLGFA